MSGTQGDGVQEESVNTTTMAMATTLPFQGAALWNHLIAAFGAGAFTTVLLHPIDLIKVRLQAQDDARAGRSAAANAKYPQRHPHRPVSSSGSKFVSRRLPYYYTGSLNAVRSIIAGPEGWRGLYAGLLPSLIGSSVSWGLYFFIYNNAKSRWRQQLGAEYEAGGLSSWHHLVSAAEAGVLVSILTNPIWVLKTRFQLQMAGRYKAEAGGKGRHLVPGAYTGLGNAVRSVWIQEGLRGFYRGLVASLLLFMAYEELTRWSKKVACGHAANGASYQEQELSALQISAIGAGSKLFAAVLSYPSQVVRTRLQQRQTPPSSSSSSSSLHSGVQYKGTISTFRSIYVREGFGGFYKGMMPNLMRTLPQSAVFFLTYEKLFAAISRDNGG